MPTHSSQQSKLDRQKPAPALVCVDADNIKVTETGFARIDIRRFCARARATMGNQAIIKVFANGMSMTEEAIWNENRAEVIRTVTNADPVIINTLYDAEACAAVLIASGDHGFSQVARFHRHLAHRVVVWSTRAKLAYELIFAADAVEFIDNLVVPVPQKRPTTAMRFTA